MKERNGIGNFGHTTAFLVLLLGTSNHTSRSEKLSFFIFFIFFHFYSLVILLVSLFFSCFRYFYVFINFIGDIFKLL